MKDGLSRLPIWVQAIAIVGFPALISVYLLGMIPFLPSPIHELISNQRALADGLQKHDRTSREMLRIYRLTCRGVWKGSEEVQDQCDSPRENGR